MKHNKLKLVELIIEREIIMEKYEEILDTMITEPFCNFNTLFIDIETDGLSHKNTIIMIGMILVLKHKVVTFIQLFNEDYLSEQEMLLELKSIIIKNHIEYYISFNGHSFDFPFINARYKHFKINYSLKKAMNIDLLRLVKKHKVLFDLPDYKLKSIEKSIGILRNDTISGKDSIDLYKAFIKTQNLNFKKTILLHNYEDLINMIPLLDITKKVNYAVPIYKQIQNSKIYLESYNFSENTLSCTFQLTKQIHLQDIRYTTPFVNFECVNETAKLIFQLVKLYDTKTNYYQFINPLALIKTPLSELNTNQKEKYLVKYNQEIFLYNLEKVALDVFEHIIMDIITF